MTYGAGASAHRQLRRRAIPAGDIGTPGAAPPGAYLYGVTRQAIGKRRHAIAPRISPDGQRLKRALYSLNLKCSSGTDQVVDSPKQNLEIGATGKVSITETFSRVISRHRRFRLKESFSAVIGSTDATGSFQGRGTRLQSSYRPHVAAV